MSEAAAELREIGGPSAVGGGRRRFFDLLWLVSVTEFKRSYFGTVLGYFWTLARPVLLFAVLLAVFTQVFRLEGVPYYPVMLLLNVVVFSFIQEATVTAVTSVVAQEGVVRKTQFPRLVIPLAVVLTALLNLALNLLAVFVFIVAWGIEPTWTWLLFPFALVALVALATAMSMLLSALYVRFRDLAIIWSVAVTALFYGTPVLYPFENEVVPDVVRDVISLNPLTPIFIQIRAWVIDPGAPSAPAAMGTGWFLCSLAIGAALCVAAAVVFNREAPRIAEEL